MNFAKTAACSCVVSLLALACPLWAQTEVAEKSRRSCGSFVQTFYDWYLPRAQKEDFIQRALEHRKSSFSPELIRAVQEDYAAAARVPDEIVGLDFDPFLNTQDPAHRYVTGRVDLKQQRCWVAVYGIQNGRRSANRDVTPELTMSNGRWKFVNFHYPEPSCSKCDNLLSLLDRLRREREKSGKPR
jgi:hypothetical protein